MKRLYEEKMLCSNSLKVWGLGVEFREVASYLSEKEEERGNESRYTPACMFSTSYLQQPNSRTFFSLHRRERAYKTSFKIDAKFKNKYDG